MPSLLRRTDGPWRLAVRMESSSCGTGTRADRSHVFEPLAPIERGTDHDKKTAELTKALVDAFKSRQFQKCIDATSALDQHAGELGDGGQH